MMHEVNYDSLTHVVSCSCGWSDRCEALKAAYLVGDHLRYENSRAASEKNYFECHRPTIRELLERLG